MKKILLSVAFLGATFIGAKAQQTISFEASEGFTLGSINDQNGWIVTGDGSGGFISNQNVSDAMASEGDYSFRIAADTNFGPQQNPIMGGLYNFASVPNQNVSFDIYISDVIDDGADYRLALANVGEGFFTMVIHFSYNGQIGALSEDSLFLIGEWEPNTWYNIKMGTTDTELLYSLNGEVFSFPGTDVQLGNIDHLRFVHDNYNSTSGGFAHLDNLKINVEPFTASTEDFLATSFSIYPNPATDVISVSNGVDTIQNVKITDLKGRVVKDISFDIEQAQINISDLAQGVYILNATSNGKTITEKIVKK